MVNAMPEEEKVQQDNDREDVGFQIGAATSPERGKTSKAAKTQDNLNNKMGGTNHQPPRKIR